MNTRAAWLLLSAAVLTTATALALQAQESLRGRAKIVDGDSFEIGAVGVRLYGVDAPEGRQTCTRGGSAWRCGEAAAGKLRELTRNRDVECRRRDVDDYGRIVAICRAGNVDLGAEMVRSGHAFAYLRYSNDYADEERDARTARRGVWAGEAQAPWDWRREPERDERARRPQPRTTAAHERGCDIKGNVNGDGERIYHVPGSSSYDQTTVNESDGERWFCTEAEARRAGWRAPRG